MLEIGRLRCAKSDNYTNTSQFRSRYAAIIVAPQCQNADAYGNNWGGFGPDATFCEQTSIDLIRSLIDNNSVNRKNVFVTGLSLGAIGTWDMIWRYPGLFAAALPLAGAEPYQNLNKTFDYLTMPIYAVHGDIDDQVLVHYDREMFSAVRSMGGQLMKYDEYHGYGHDVWDAVYANNYYWDWLFSNGK